MANEIKVIKLNEKEVERRITLNLVQKISGGMEAAGDVFNEKGMKTGFYRYRSQYEFPVFFSKTGRRLYGDSPINIAIKEVVHNWAVSINATRKEAVEKTVQEESPAPKKQENSLLNSVSKETLLQLGFTTKQADAIIEWRQNYEVKSLADFSEVKGVGPKTIEKAEKKWKEVTEA